MQCPPPVGPLRPARRQQRGRRRRHAVRRRDRSARLARFHESSARGAGRRRRNPETCRVREQVCARRAARTRFVRGTEGTPGSAPGSALPTQAPTSGSSSRAWGSRRRWSARGRRRHDRFHLRRRLLTASASATMRCSRRVAAKPGLPTSGAVEAKSGTTPRLCQNTSARQREGHASTGRSRRRGRPRRRARRPAHERGTSRQARRCVPIFAGVVTATPPARALERGGAGRTSWSSSQSQPQSRSARSRPSRCPPRAAKPGSAEAASARPRAAASARRTSSPDWAPIPLRRASDSQRRAASPSPAAARTRNPERGAAPALAATSPSSAVIALPSAAMPACDSRRYCWRRG